jgi:hypothetical protein
MAEPAATTAPDWPAAGVTIAPPSSAIAKLAERLTRLVADRATIGRDVAQEAAAYRAIEQRLDTLRAERASKALAEAGAAGEPDRRERK